ncbi:trehalose-phosphatase [Spiribacter onubensis]|jgi:trehalose 6-phosphate phosphatase|uniref:Trehalose 6-phosphate phosphatase n=1 Tax=Spiribacter onubensis TaxID=3122420 RepID=A0ABV3SAZ3_9GAMM
MSGTSAASMRGLPTPDVGWALFLDFDGTLVEIAEHPDAVTVPDALPGLLTALVERLSGAVAIVSGRDLAGLDALLDGALPAMAGIHGLERRDGQGRLYRPVDHSERFSEVRAALRHFVETHPGTSMEDKGNALTLHYRGAPAVAEEAAAVMHRHCEALGDEFRVQPGKRVLELRPSSHHKGTVVQAFMAEPPFRGRTPVFIGDDVTDEDAFRAVNDLGGHSIRVGTDRPTAAQYEIESVNEALQWLTGLARRLTPPS